jgi:hypothetical protein
VLNRLAGWVVPVLQIAHVELRSGGVEVPAMRYSWMALTPSSATSVGGSTVWQGLADMIRHVIAHMMPFD